MRIPCFLVEPSGTKRVTVSAWWAKGECPQDKSGRIGHRCDSVLLEGSAEECEARWERGVIQSGDVIDAVCKDCGVVGGKQPVTSAGMQYQWVRRDTGRVAWSPTDFGPGAMYVAEWYAVEEENGRKKYLGYWDNQYEPPLYVMTPGGEWNIDSRARNCTMPQERTHRCWIRDGEPPAVTVNKNGFTCSAGAGSIQCGSYHGFLRGGYLVDC